MQWLFRNFIRLFDHKVKRDRREPSSLDAFRKRAMQNICICGFLVALISGFLALRAGRMDEFIGMELPICLVSLTGFFAIRRVSRVEWIAGFYMLLLSSCVSYWMIFTAKTAYGFVHFWYPIMGFSVIILSGRRIGLLYVCLIGLESLLVLGVNKKYGFVLPQWMSAEAFVISAYTTVLSSLAAAYAIIASVEISRQRADRANTKANALNLRRASLSLMGDMALDVSHNMQAPLASLHAKLAEVLTWNPTESLHNRGPILLQNLQQSLREMVRLTESLLLFNHTEGSKEIVALRAVNFLNYLNELTREKAISRRVSLDFSADQPQLMLHLPIAITLFALVSLVSKGVEAAAGQEPAWVRVQLRVFGRQLHIRISDSGASLSLQDRSSIVQQTAQMSTWDVNLRLSLEFLASIDGQLTLDPYSPDTCYVIIIPMVQAKAIAA